jgi:N-acetylglucosamine-6-phosphate deacetylase
MRSAGLFDLQVNGFAGVDFNSEAIDADQLDHALEAMLTTGVTSCLPTVITAPAPILAERFAALDAAVARSRLGPVMVPGYHLEGPFLNPADGYAGCHPPAAMSTPEAALVDRLASELSRPILLVTVAPELAGGESFIRSMTAGGRVVAIGHSAADSEVVTRAVRAGAALSTHLGNGLPQLLHKVVNPIFAQLAEDDLYASFIADGIHLPRQALKTMLRAKGIERSILVSDAVSAAGAKVGLYQFAGMSVEHAADGSVRLPGSHYLAGSALTLDRAVRNLVEWKLATSDDAIRMASRNPHDLMKPALAAFGVACNSGETDWSTELWPTEVRIGSIRRTIARPDLAEEFAAAHD